MNDYRLAVAPELAQAYVVISLFGARVSSQKLPKGISLAHYERHLLLV